MGGVEQGLLGLDRDAQVPLQLHIAPAQQTQHANQQTKHATQPQPIKLICPTAGNESTACRADCQHDQHHAEQGNRPIGAIHARKGCRRPRACTFHHRT